MTNESSEFDPRMELGLFLRGFREDFYLRMGCPQKKTLSRKRLAGRVNVSEEVIINLEHGVVNPERCVFERTISALKIPEENCVEAYALLNQFSTPSFPRRKKRFKLHSNFSIRTRRHPRQYR